MFEDDYDMIFKIILVGDSGVGKTNIHNRYIKNDFNINTKSTVGVEFASKNIILSNTRIKAKLWDTAGQERYKSITNAYYNGAKGAFIVYDLSRKETFQNTDKWLLELNTNTDNDITVILIGNKSDLETNREVTREEAEAKADQYQIAYFETFLL
jgi:small GTP-binding protein